MTSKYRNSIGRCLAVLGMLLVIASGCSSTGPTPTPPPSAKEPPIYPNAINVVRDYTGVNVKRATFQTNDSSAAVRRYYTGVLQNDGWKVETVAKPATPDSLYLSWGGPNSEGFSIDIVITSLASGLVNVEINLVAHSLRM